MAQLVLTLTKEDLNEQGKKKAIRYITLDDFAIPIEWIQTSSLIIYDGLGAIKILKSRKPIYTC